LEARQLFSGKPTHEIATPLAIHRPVKNEAPAIVVDQTVSPDSNSIVAEIPGSWNLEFDDEFNGNSLNAPWQPVQPYSAKATLPPGELESYDSAGVSVSNGLLHLTASKQRTYGRAYQSGLVQAGGIMGSKTAPKFSFTYGYMEVSAQIPAGKGFWPAIWMLPASYHNIIGGEIDVLETFGGNTSNPFFTVHRRGRTQQFSMNGVDLSQGFHTYGVDWEPDHITWYIDGQAVATTTNTKLIPTEAMYPIINLAVGGLGGRPPASTTFPEEMDVDYVRIWQQGS